MPRPSKKSIKFLAEQVNYYHGCAENAPRESDEYAENSFNDVRILKCLLLFTWSLCEYEKERLKNIKENIALLEELGLKVVLL